MEIEFVLRLGKGIVSIKKDDSSIFAIDRGGDFVAAWQEGAKAKIKSSSPVKNPILLHMHSHAAKIFDKNKMIIPVSGNLAFVVDKSNSKIHELDWHSAPIDASAFDPKGTKIATGSQDGEVCLAEITEDSIRLESEFEHLPDYISAIDFSKDGAKMAYGAYNGDIMFYDLETMTKILNFRT